MVINPMADELVKIAEESTRGGFFLFFGTAASTVIMALSSIMVARLLGPELYGQYALAIVVPQMLFLFTDVGINSGIIKYAASLKQQGETNRIPRIVKYGMLLKVSVGIGIFLLSYALSGFFATLILKRPDLEPYIKIASTAIILQVIFTTATSTFVGLDKTEYNALTVSLEAFAKAAVSISLVALGFGVAGALIGHVAGYAIAAITGLALTFMLIRKMKSTSTYSGQSASNDLKMLLHYGMPLYVSALLTGLIPTYQNMVLALYATDYQVGNYKAATNFIALMHVITMPIATALLPAFSKLNSTTNHKINQFFKTANKYTALLITPITCLIIILSSEIVQIVYGSTYNSAPTFLATYSLLYLLTGLGYLTLTSLFNGLGDTKTTLKTSLITFITVVALSPILTQNYSVQGLITSFITASLLSTLYGVYVGKAKLGISFEKHSLVKIYLISALSSIPTCILVFYLDLPSLITVAMGALLYLFIYATLLPITGTVTRMELHEVALVTQKTKLLTRMVKPLLKYENAIINLTAKPARTK